MSDTKSINSSRTLTTIFVVMLMTLPAFSQGMTKGIMSPPANVRPPSLKNVGIEQHLDDQIPPELVFRDETGKSVRLGDYFGKKPVILNLVYYQCTMLCGEVLSGLESALRVLKFGVGKEFDVLTVSLGSVAIAMSGVGCCGGVVVSPQPANKAIIINVRMGRAYHEVHRGGRGSLPG